MEQEAHPRGKGLHSSLTWDLLYVPSLLHKIKKNLFPLITEGSTEGEMGDWPNRCNDNTGKRRRGEEVSALRQPLWGNGGECA